MLSPVKNQPSKDIQLKPVNQVQSVLRKRTNLSINHQSNQIVN